MEDKWHYMWALAAAVGAFFGYYEITGGALILLIWMYESNMQDLNRARRDYDEMVRDYEELDHRHDCLRDDYHQLKEETNGTL